MKTVVLFFSLVISSLFVSAQEEGNGDCYRDH